MTREEIFKNVLNIFRDIFDDDDLIIKNETSADDIDEWDSLNHINLVSVIEAECNIKFALGELEGLNNVGAMVDLMEKKINQ